MVVWGSLVAIEKWRWTEFNVMDWVEVFAMDYGACDCFDTQDSWNEVSYSGLPAGATLSVRRFELCSNTRQDWERVLSPHSYHQSRTERSFSTLELLHLLMRP